MSRRSSANVDGWATEGGARRRVTHMVGKANVLVVTADPPDIGCEGRLSNLVRAAAAYLRHLSQCQLIDPLWGVSITGTPGRRSPRNPDWEQDSKFRFSVFCFTFLASNMKTFIAEVRLSGASSRTSPSSDILSFVGPG